MTREAKKSTTEGGLSFSLKCDLTELDHLHTKVESFGRANKLQKRTIFETNLVLEEIFTNIVSYAHEDNKPHEVYFSLKLGEGKINIQIKDDGKPFDLLKAEPVDLETDIDKREVGGLGIHLVRKLMDEVAYRRIDGENVVTLKKDFVKREE